MRLRWLAFGVVLVAGGSIAKAQVGIYGKFDYTRYSASNSGALNYVGGGVGVYDDLVHLGPLSLGLDLRGDLSSESKLYYRSLLGGVRVAFRVPLVSLRPYVQGSIGVGGTKPKDSFAVGISNAHYSNKLTYEGLVGADLGVLPHVDWRVIELGGGKQSDRGSGAPTLFLLSTGIVVRF